MIEMTLVDIRRELPSNQPILLLREARGERYLPIWIGNVEAAAIAQHKIPTARPLTHDLMKDVIEALGAALLRVEITDLEQGAYYASLVFDGGQRVSARPSDSVALAQRTGTPIYAAEAVLEEAGLLAPSEHEESSEVEAFRAFLDSVSPEDFRSAGA